MGGINTVSGLRNVSIDYRPQVGPDAARAAGAQQQAPDEIAGQGDNIINTGARPQADKAKSIVRQLDTLLLNAAGKSVSADAEELFTPEGVRNGIGKVLVGKFQGIEGDLRLTRWTGRIWTRSTR